MGDKDGPLRELVKWADKMWSGRAEAATAAQLVVCAVEQADEVVTQQ